MNRSHPDYKKAKAEFLKARELWNGYYLCNHCLRQTNEPELDHIRNTGMGGSPSRLTDEKNFQILCFNCHYNKTNNIRS